MTHAENLLKEASEFMKQEAILRLLFAIVLFTLVPFLYEYRLVASLFTVMGIYFVVTGASKFGKKRPKK
ncbi:hypothetical protein D3C80_2179430 [compost metagenome]